MSKEINLLELSEKNREIKKFYAKMAVRNNLSTQFWELYHKKYGKGKDNSSDTIESK